MTQASGRPRSEEGTHCPVCGGNPPVHVFRLARGPVAQCADCGVFIIEDRSTNSEHDRVYHENVDRSRFIAYFEPFRKTQYREVLTRIGEAGGRSLLDVGAAYGWMLEVGSELGFDCYGIEPSTIEYKPTLANRILARTLAEHAARSPRRYDVVTMWHVIEHLEDPFAGIRQIRDLLSRDGIAVIAVPNAGGGLYRVGSALARTLHYNRLMDELWYTHNPNMHRYYFTPQALSRLVRTADLGIEEVFTWENFDWKRIWVRSTNTVGRTVLRVVGPGIHWSRFTANENLILIAQNSPVASAIS